MGQDETAGGGSDDVGNARVHVKDAEKPAAERFGGQDRHHFLLVGPYQHIRNRLTDLGDDQGPQEGCQAVDQGV